MKTKTTLLAAVGLMTSLSFTAVQTARAQCRDPWINNAYREVAGRAPSGTGDVGECYTKLYNDGSWNNYNELKRYVQELRNNNIKIAYANAGNYRYAMAISQNGYVAVNLIDFAGNMVAAGGGNMVAAGGGNMVAAGGGNMVAAGGGNLNNGSVNLVGNDGASIKIDKNTPGFSPASGYSLQSGRIIKTSGKGGLKIR